MQPDFEKHDEIDAVNDTKQNKKIKATDERLERKVSSIFPSFSSTTTLQLYCFPLAFHSRKFQIGSLIKRGQFCVPPSTSSLFELKWREREREREMNLAYLHNIADKGEVDKNGR